MPQKAAIRLATAVITFRNKERNIRSPRNYTNFERNLAMIMMVIYLPVKFEFDWTQHFRVRVRKRKF